MNKTVPIKISIKSDNPDWNPIFNSIQVGPNEGADGSFLTICGTDSTIEITQVSLAWSEWDELVRVVSEYRNDWEWR